MVEARGGWVVPVVASLVLCSLIAPALVAGAGAGASGQAFTQEETEFDADRTVFDVTVHPNGSAEWQFRYERGLADDAERQDFEAFAEEFNAEETEMYADFRDRSNALAQSAANETGREMSAEAFWREARVEGFEDDLAVVEMGFRWDGFAAANDRVVVGDVFEGGLYIGPNQRLVFRPGPGLAFQDVQPNDGELSAGTLAESGSVTWEGERSFNNNRPRIVFVDPDSAENGDGGQTETVPPAPGNSSWLLPAGALALVVILGLGAAAAYRSGALPGSRDGGAASKSSGGSGPGAGAGAGVSGAAGADAEADEQPMAVPEEELLSDEEQVVNLLEDNGGRMKQVNIVDETGWSKSKVSMLLSDMEEEGTISKLRVGRENIVSLAGHEPDAAGSPFDDDG